MHKKDKKENNRHKINKKINNGGDMKIKKNKELSKIDETKMSSKIRSNKRNHTNCACRNYRSLDNTSNNKYQCSARRKWISKTS